MLQSTTSTGSKNGGGSSNRRGTFSIGKLSTSSSSFYLMYIVIAFLIAIIGIQRSSVLNLHQSQKTQHEQQTMEIQHIIASSSLLQIPSLKSSLLNAADQTQKENSVSAPQREIESTTATTAAATSTVTVIDDVITPPSSVSSVTTSTTLHERKIPEETTDAVINDSINDEKEVTRDPNKKLNIVLFYADDWTFFTLGAMGNKYVQTPNLDQLAKDDGMLFTHNCVVTSVCMQSRATLYTGQYSSVHQTFYAWRDIKMYEEGKWNETLYPSMLRNNYHTGFFGKYHHIEDFSIPTFTKYHSLPMEHVTNCRGEMKHITECIEQDGMEFLTSRPMDEPFFLTMSFFATHAQDDTPIHYIAQNYTSHIYTDDDIIPNAKTHTYEHWKALPPFFSDENLGRARYRGRYDTTENYQNNMKTMYRMATEVDATCGKIMNLLKLQGVYDDTVIIFTTDNGNFHGEHGLSEKWYPYEESIRVPLIIKDPRMIPSLKGTINSEFTLNIDLAPTILSAANVPVPDRMQGRDMSLLYRGTKPNVKVAKDGWRKEFLYEFWWDNGGIPNSIALVGKDYKYIVWTDNRYAQYFNLTEDPYEEHDLLLAATTTTTSPVDPAILTRMQERLQQLQLSAKSGVQQ